MKVLTYNTMFLPPRYAGDWNNKGRADLIGRADFLKGHDFVLLQELFDPGPSAALTGSLAGLGYRHQTPVVGASREGWDATHGAYSDWRLRGGVAIASTTEISRREQHIFTRSCGWDAYACKGFAYVVTSWGGRRLHLVGLHLQSTDSGCKGRAALVRRMQLRELAAFLKDKNIPADEFVVVGGDFNIDTYSEEYADLASFGGLEPEEKVFGPRSFDTKSNSLARHRYPDDPAEDLDHVLLRKGHARPAGAWRHKVLPVRSPLWKVGSSAFTDYSDHYPRFVGDLPDENDNRNGGQKVKRGYVCKLKNKASGRYVGTDKTATENAYVVEGDAIAGPNATSQMWHFFPVDGTNEHLVAHRKGGQVMTFVQENTGGNTVRNACIRPAARASSTTATPREQRWVLHEASGQYRRLENSGYVSRYLTVSYDDSKMNLVLGPKEQPGSEREGMDEWLFTDKKDHETPVPAALETMGDVIRLKGFEEPAEKKTKEWLLAYTLLPFPLVTDPAAAPRVQAEYYPYYVLKRYGYWERVYYYEHSGHSEHTERQTTFDGFVGKSHQTVVDTTGISVTASAGFTYKAITASLSATLSRELKMSYGTEDTKTHTKTYEVVRTYKVGPRVAEAVWHRGDHYVLERPNGQKALEWNTRTKASTVVDGWPNKKTP